jgi:hypothetical protein
MVLEKQTQSRTEIPEPSRELPKIDRDELNLQKERKLQELPRSTTSRALRLDPRRHDPNKLNVDAARKKDLKDTPDPR